MTLNKAIFLDRDGVLNAVELKQGRPHPPKSLSDLKILPKVHEALMKLKAKGYLLIVVTNQPDVVRGVTSMDEVESINHYLKQELPLDDIRTCYHDDMEACSCRKPKPGLLTKAAKDYCINLEKSYMIGDRWRDIDAGRMAGVKTIWIDSNYLEQQPEFFDYKADSLYESLFFID